MMLPINLDFLKVLPPWVYLLCGGVLGWIKSFWYFIYDHSIGWVSKKIKVEITIEEQDHKEAFVWLNLWMEKHLERRRINNLRLERSRGKEFLLASDINDTNAFTLLPGYGFYYLWWKRKLLTFDSSRKEIPGASGSVPLRRTINLTIWGTRNRGKIIEVLKEARASFEVKKKKILKYYIHQSDWWDDNELPVRSMDTIYLPDNQTREIESTIEDFLSSEDKYRKLGIPWRLGLLFEGPAGTGKTSLVQAISCRFDIPIYYLNVKDNFDAGALQGLMSSVGRPCILLIEDIDSVGAAIEREDEKSDDSKKSGFIKTKDLLNLFDGIIATEHRILIMTSNHPDKIDRALLRPGRVDRRFHIGYTKDTELLRFYNNVKCYYTLPSFEEFRNSLPENYTVADAQSKVFEIQANLDKLIEK